MNTDMFRAVRYVMTAPGVVMGEGENIPTVEEIASGWDTLMSQSLSCRIRSGMAF